MRKLNVLVTTPYPLVPANSGGRRYALSVISALKSEVDLHLLATCNADERRELEQGSGELMRQYHEVFRTVRFVERPRLLDSRPGAWRKLGHLATHSLLGLPLMDLSYFSLESVQAALEIAREQKIDLLECHHLHTAFYRRFLPDLPAVLVNHNIESDLWPFWEHERPEGLKRTLRHAFAERSRRNAHDIELENRFHFDAKLFISPLDMARVAAREDCVRQVLPMAVPLDRSPKPFNAGKMVILWVGGFDWEPNREAGLWFIREIWPLLAKQSKVPTEVHLVGSNPPDELRKAHDGKQVFVHGFVEDVSELYRSADAFIVPIRSGGGIRIKIVDALNAGLPVVSTSKGSEGLLVSPEKDILIADDPEQFARQLLRLAASPQMREELSRGARDYCSRQHSPEGVAGTKREVYRSILRGEAASLI